MHDGGGWVNGRATGAQRAVETHTDSFPLETLHETFESTYTVSVHGLIAVGAGRGERVGGRKAHLHELRRPRDLPLLVGQPALWLWLWLEVRVLDGGRRYT